MDSVISMTKQGVRNLNNLGPKKKKVIAAEAQTGEGEPAKQDEAAEQPAAEAATATATATE